MYNHIVYFTVSETLRNTCPEIDLKNGRTIGKDVQFGAEVIFRCNRRKGYYLIGDSRQVCLECGRWSGGGAYCQPEFSTTPATTPAPHAATESSNISNTYPTQTTPRLTLGNEVPNPTQP